MRLYEFGRERLGSDQQCDPPRPAPIGFHFGAPYQVAFTDDADQASTVCDNGDGTDPILEQGFGNILHRTVRAHSNDCGDHDISGFHVGYFRRISATDPL